MNVKSLALLAVFVCCVANTGLRANADTLATPPPTSSGPNLQVITDPNQCSALSLTFSNGDKLSGVNMYGYCQALIGSHTFFVLPCQNCNSPQSPPHASLVLNGVQGNDDSIQLIGVTGQGQEFAATTNSTVIHPTDCVAVSLTWYLFGKASSSQRTDTVCLGHPDVSGGLSALKNSSQQATGALGALNKAPNLQVITDPNQCSALSVTFSNGDKLSGVNMYGYCQSLMGSHTFFVLPCKNCNSPQSLPHASLVLNGVQGNDDSIQLLGVTGQGQEFAATTNSTVIHPTDCVAISLTWYLLGKVSGNQRTDTVCLGH